MLTEDELPTIGIILCRRNNDASVELTLPKNANIFAPKYPLYLPSKAVMTASAEMIRMYWDIGHMVALKQESEGWGTSVIPRLSTDLRNDLPETKGFSERNISRMIAFFRAYPGLDEILPQFVAKIDQNHRILDLSQAVAKTPGNEAAKNLLVLVPKIPRGHNILLMEKVKDLSTRKWYKEQVLENGWSRAMLTAAIKSNIHDRQGAAVTNFDRQLPQTHAKLAKETLKDPYIFDLMNEDVQMIYILNVVIGIMLLAFGRRLFWLFVGCVGFVAGLQMAQLYLGPSPAWVAWTVALGFGLIGALLAVFFQTLAIGLGGFAAGSTISAYLMVLMGFTAIPLISVVVGGIIGTILLFAFFDCALIGLSSVAGATLIVQALFCNFRFEIILYVALIVVGIFFQTRSKKTIV